MQLGIHFLLFLHERPVNQLTDCVALYHKEFEDPCPTTCKQKTDHHLSKAPSENLETLIKFL
jgi:hypothetical protein